MYIFQFSILFFILLWGFGGFRGLRGSSWEFRGFREVFGNSGGFRGVLGNSGGFRDGSRMVPGFTDTHLPKFDLGKDICREIILSNPVPRPPPPHTHTHTQDEVSESTCFGLVYEDFALD